MKVQAEENLLNLKSYSSLQTVGFSFNYSNYPEHFAYSQI